MDKMKTNLMTLIDELNIEFEKIISRYAKANIPELKKMQIKMSFTKNILEDVFF